ncbi:MAG: type II toxin-antitoxin system VapC family toxin [Mastigocoleus sp. MO_167.B18]|uniref:type II toxin-antitoxin system VapC family toxin n=1 Tax=Mastigocoleus sp. MO_188.B34 TaxID=3036635 RepID=UPI0026130027|nr:type II toxin-antitoxin system VapC family toxin [Mastigocoleus sp. MO_188.B34]MDJ0693017.1 type II toxin-antitoxin system VapC family toxin [Mastigocoleus sp. MO_188.B34]MDJ0775291.1 type II toxin-antitoxin system VapC family toxin [Mastigocoleus sp. MO_167.B18]
MRVLLDTCVLSELYKPIPLESVKNAVNSLLDNDIYISVITLGEISKGISLLSESRCKRDLSVWFNNIEHIYAERVLQIDSEIAAIWGEITAIAQKKGFILAAADGLIAATALRHGLYLMTRNVKDFEVTGVLLLNPWNDVS